jgi:hypothetical protein
VSLVPVSNTPNLTFDDILRQADILAQSRIIPRAYQNRAADIVASGLAGLAFGWDVMTSLRNYHVIEGTASLRPEAMLGLVRKAGHSVQISIDDIPDNPGKRMAVATGIRKDTGDEHTATFSTDDAKAANLLGKNNWKQYESAMLQWRAVSSLCRVLFPDVVLGAGYVPEELGGEAMAVEMPSEDDPLDDPLLRSAEAKRLLIEACDGDKEKARRYWGERGSNSLRLSELEAILRQIDQDDTVIDAEIVEPAAEVPESTADKQSPAEGNVEQLVANLDLMEKTLDHLKEVFEGAETVTD